MNANRQRHINDFLLGGIGILFSITGYFLVSRDTEIRDGIQSVGSEISAIKIDVQRITSEEQECQFRVRSLETAVAEIRQRLARVEALVEKRRENQQ